MPQNPVIVDTVRTPFGKANGALTDFHPQDLAAKPLKALETRNQFNAADDVDDVIYGCASPEDEQGYNIGRIAPLLAGWGEDVPGVQLNRGCGSGQQAVNYAAAQIGFRETGLYVAGGVEHMTRVLLKNSDSLTMDQEMISERYYQYFDELTTQGEGAERIAEEYDMTQEEVDSIAVDSQKRYENARDAQHLDDHITGIDTTQNGSRVSLAKDQHPRPATDLETLSSLTLQFRAEGNGVLHAGNSSGMVDGAAAILIADQNTADDRGWDPMTEIVDTHLVGVDPLKMLKGPIPATQEILDRNNMTVDDVDLFEVNEAFAPVIAAWLEETGAAWEDTNVWGGAIAHGHPLGATGAMLIGKLSNQLQQYDFEYGLCTMCIGMGQGIATLLKRT